MSDDYGLHSPAEQWSEQDDWEQSYSELEAIARDLAVASIAGAMKIDQLAALKDRAAAWVAAHPMSEDPQ